VAKQGRYLPKYVECKFDEFLRCGKLEHGFLLVVCGDARQASSSLAKDGFCGNTGAYTFGHDSRANVTRSGDNYFDYNYVDQLSSISGIERLL
jgi:hypothetical protein